MFSSSIGAQAATAANFTNYCDMASPYRRLEQPDPSEGGPQAACITMENALITSLKAGASEAWMGHDILVSSLATRTGGEALAHTHLRHGHHGHGHHPHGHHGQGHEGAGETAHWDLRASTAA